MAQEVILIAEDNDVLRKALSDMLAMEGFVVLAAANGQEALEKMGSITPDLIVSDIAMPRINGFDLTRQIKEDERMADLPVILVTSLDSPEDKARGIDAGADAYIVKSRFDQSALLETIEQLI